MEKEVRQLLRDPKTKGVIFVSPVIQLLLVGYAVNMDIRNVALALADHDRTRAPRELVDAFTASGYFRIEEIPGRAGGLGAALDRGRAAAALEIPGDFSRDLHAGRGAVVQSLVDGTNSSTATVAQGYAAKIVQEVGLRRAAESAAGAPLAGPASISERAPGSTHRSSRASTMCLP